MKERIKSAVLFLLIVLSIAQTGMLWYSSPSYQENRPSYIQPPLIGNEQYNQIPLHERLAFHPIVVHRNGKQSWIFPDDPLYRDFLNRLRQSRWDVLKPVVPEPEEWNLLYRKITGVELQFVNDLPADAIDVMNEEEFSLSGINQISRIWIHGDSRGQNIRLWLISDRERKVLESEIDFPDYNEWFAKVGQKVSRPVKPHFVSGKIPMDEEKDKKPSAFPLAVYLPDLPLTVRSFTFPLKQIKADDIKWLFTDPNQIWTLPSEEGDTFTDGNRMLQHNQRNQTMVYRDLRSEPKPSSASIELEILNQFMKTHNGWTGSYSLDRRIKEDDIHLYIFRLMVGGLPVYWPGEEKGEVRPDTIRLKVSADRVAEYHRSLRYLSSEPSKSRDSLLPGRDSVIRELSNQGLSLKQLHRLFPAYHVVVLRDQVRLIPVWIALKKNGESIHLNP